MTTNWYKIFYWLTVADNFKSLFITLIVIFMIICVIATFWFVFDRETNTLKATLGAERAKRWMWWSYPLCILFWALYIATPSKSDTLLIIAGGSVGNFVTSDSSSRQIPAGYFRHQNAKRKIH